MDACSERTRILVMNCNPTSCGLLLLTGKCPINYSPPTDDKSCCMLHHDELLGFPSCICKGFKRICNHNSNNSSNRITSL